MQYLNSSPFPLISRFSYSVHSHRLNKLLLAYLPSDSDKYQGLSSDFL